MSRLTTPPRHGLPDAAQVQVLFAEARRRRRPRWRAGPRDGRPRPGRPGRCPRSSGASAPAARAGRSRVLGGSRRGQSGRCRPRWWPGPQGSRSRSFRPGPGASSARWRATSACFRDYRPSRYRWPASLLRHCPRPRTVDREHPADRRPRHPDRPRRHARDQPGRPAARVPGLHREDLPAEHPGPRHEAAQPEAIVVRNLQTGAVRDGRSPPTFPPSAACRGPRTTGTWPTHPCPGPAGCSLRRTSPSCSIPGQEAR